MHPKSSQKCIFFWFFGRKKKKQDIRRVFLSYDWCLVSYFLRFLSVFILYTHKLHSTYTPFTRCLQPPNRTQSIPSFVEWLKKSNTFSFGLGWPSKFHTIVFICSITPWLNIVCIFVIIAPNFPCACFGGCKQRVYGCTTCV